MEKFKYLLKCNVNLLNNYPLGYYVPHLYSQLKKERDALKDWLNTYIESEEYKNKDENHKINLNLVLKDIDKIDAHSHINTILYRKLCLLILNKHYTEI